MNRENQVYLKLCMEMKWLCRYTAIAVTAETYQASA
jgi:hypothetical protein